MKKYYSSLEGRLARVCILFTGLFIGAVLMQLVIIVKGSNFTLTTLIIMFILAIVIFASSILLVYKDYDYIESLVK